ncbi:uncharacterized protein LOC118280520 [Spodoptera frugiperda]|uniref:Uncharacterized protein LOC118280520 n=1 Tax=Spodoptera frugiperda TaxID=7108 RepID=A0A9R0DJ99_SPOFR|nr:uncharacterized protein LOC118280520 [Spodoptera frugiperda]
MYNHLCFVIFFVIIKCTPTATIVLVVIPEDVPAGLAAIFGFAPPLHKGNDHRFGFGFRLGNHADFQVLYEFGPQLVTKPLQTSRVRSATYRQRFARRRPVIELLVRAGIIKRNYDYNAIEECDDEPR